MHRDPRETVCGSPEVLTLLASASRRSTRRSGRIDENTNHAGLAEIVVETGPWKSLLKQGHALAGVVREIDVDDEIVYVNRTKDEIKNAPEVDESLTTDENYRTRLGSYYGPGGSGYRDWN